MKTKIIVHGKSQSRTALGIINAYLKLHPEATPFDVMKAFPKWLNRRCTVNNLIIPVEKTMGHEKMFFEHEDELIVFNNGEMFALVEVWDKDDFKAICDHAKQYGIKVAKIGTQPFEKGSFELEYIGWDGKRCLFRWWWLLVLILLLLLAIFCCKECCNDARSSHHPGPVTKFTPAPSNTNSKPPVATTINRITDRGASILVALPDGKVLNIAKNSSEYRLFSFLNSPDIQVDADKTKGWIPMDDIHFETGKAVLLPESDEQLNNIALMMQFFPNSCIKIGGYTDNTGSNEVNMRLSHERAKATFDRLVASGVAADRMAHEGYGSNYPVSSDDRAANRRVDIRVTHK